MNTDAPPGQKPMSQKSAFLWQPLVLYAVVLLVLFWRSFAPGYIHFANDGPLGWQAQAAHRMPQMFAGTWDDLNSLGGRGGAAPSVSFGLFFALGPVNFSKFSVPIALLILAVGAWCFFRQSGLSPIACVLGGMAAVLNSGFFSAACWGVATHAITVGMSFFALAALADTTSRKRWWRVPLAGLAVGMGVTEGFDIGAIFSLYVAVCVIYQALIASGPLPRNLATGVARVGVVAIFAAFLAVQTVTMLVATQIQGIAGTQQDAQTKEQRWDYATQWSLPKREALGLIVPGLFGYRMDTPGGGSYWGAAGRDAAWDRWFASGKQGQPPGGFLRYTGGGIYAGVLVALVGLWAALQGVRKKDSVFSDANRRWLWFWSAVAIASLLLAFGKFAPFYRLLYALPYFSTIRNPAKFTHVFNWALVVLFAYGVHGLWRRYMETPAASGAGIAATVKAWWRRVRGFDRRWTVGCGVAIGASALAWLMYAANRDALVQYLQEVQFEPAMAQAIAGFSIRQVGWYLLFLTGAVGLVTLVLSGVFGGPRAKWGGVLLGLWLVVDMGRANLPWIIPVNYPLKYARDPVVDFLRERPHEQRVAILPEWMDRVLRAPPQWELIHQYYRIEWAQHHFPYYNVQSLDIVQMPRTPEDLLAFESALQPPSLADAPHFLPRRWQLTNTRYLLGAAGFLDFLNQQLDPAQQRFRILTRFDIVPKPGIPNPGKLEELTALPTTNGTYALFEFTGALPRAKLYANWQVNTNNATVLQTLASREFDPAQAVLVADPIKPPSGAVTNAGNVAFVSYAPKHIVFKATANVPAVLLLNDRFDPNWQVTVDGRRAELLRCNFIMRGVFLDKPGEHQVEFRFAPPLTTLYVSLAAIGLGVLLLGLLLVWRERPAPASSPQRPEPRKKPPVAA